MKQNNNNMLDERQQQIESKSVSFAFVFLVLCVIASMIYKIVTADSAGWELWAIIGTAFVILITNRILGNIEEPKDIFGKPLPLGDSKSEKSTRKKSYALESLCYALGFTVMETLLVSFGRDTADLELTESIFPNLDKIPTVALTAVITFVIMFAVSMVFDYLGGEHKVKRYNKMLAALESDDEEDEQ